MEMREKEEEKEEEKKEEKKKEEEKEAVHPWIQKLKNREKRGPKEKKRKKNKKEKEGRERERFDFDKAIRSEKEKEFLLLIEEARRGNISLVSRLVPNHDLSSQTRYTRLPLFGAIESGNLALVSLLIDRGADIHCVNKDGENVLHWSVAYNQPEMVQFFLSQKVNPNLISKKDTIPLIMAIKKRYSKIAQLFLSSPLLDIHQVCEERGGESAFAVAIMRKNHTLIRHFCKMGAFLHQKWDYKGTKDPLSYFVKKIEYNQSDEQDRQTLLLFLRSSYLISKEDVLKMIMDDPLSMKIFSESGIDFTTIQDKNGKTALVRLCEVGSPNLCDVNLYLKYPFDLDHQDIHGNTGLYYLSNHDYRLFPQMEYLLRAGANPIIKNKIGECPLRCLLQNRYFERGAAIALMEHGASFLDCFLEDGPIEEEWAKTFSPLSNSLFKELLERESTALKPAKKG